MQEIMNEQIIEQTRITTLNRFVNDVAERLLIYDFSIKKNGNCIIIIFEDDRIEINKAIFKLICKAVKQKQKTFKITKSWDY